MESRNEVEDNNVISCWSFILKAKQIQFSKSHVLCPPKQSVFFFNRAIGFTSSSHCSYKAGPSFARKWLLFWKSLRYIHPTMEN